MSEVVLRTEDLTRTFDGFVAVDGVDLELPRGDLRGLIGPNGAGKTTVFNMISGILAPTDGAVWFDGEEITGLPPHEITSRGLSLSFQITSIFPGLTVRENVLGALNGGQGMPSPVRRYGADPAKRRRVQELLSRVGLDVDPDEEAGTLSHGDQKVLEIALALAGDPTLLLLDEPTAGLSASETRTVEGLLKELRGEVTIVLIEHDVDLVMGLVDSLTVLHNGRVIAEGTPGEIQNDDRVQEVYFGRDG
jgi:branched-chain amino acid transport system ATP-binding protein